MDYGKTQRVLSIYTRLAGGYLINKAEEAQNYGVNERTIQRDIDDIRDFMESEKAPVFLRPALEIIQNDILAFRRFFQTSALLPSSADKPSPADS